MFNDKKVEGLLARARKNEKGWRGLERGESDEVGEWRISQVECIRSKMGGSSRGEEE